MTLASVRAKYPCLLSDLEKEGCRFVTSPAGNMEIIHSVPIITLHSLVFQRVLGALLEKKNIVVISAIELNERGEKVKSSSAASSRDRWRMSRDMSQRK